MPKKIHCAKCNRKLFSFSGGSMTSHGDNKIQIREVGGKKQAIVPCPDCGHENPVDLKLFS
ncbi:protein of unknown function [Hyphomicrobium sp. 1Nfss2.1]|uniref:hypothetical protein n=1 Tax=Hyphomicrobium sp. 1Nfss2.1 TaxID=3413936 RepID=UPI003C7BEE08